MENAQQPSQHSELNSSDGEETIAGDHVEFQQQQAINMAIIEAALNAESSDCIDASEYEASAISTSSEARFEGIQAQIAQNLQHYNSQRGGAREGDGISINLRAGISTETAPISLPPPVASTVWLNNKKIKKKFKKKLKLKKKFGIFFHQTVRFDFCV